MFNAKDVLLVQQHQKQLQQEAHLARLAKAARQDSRRHSVAAKAALHLGKALVATGARLVEVSESAADPRSTSERIAYRSS